MQACACVSLAQKPSSGALQCVRRTLPPCQAIRAGFSTALLGSEECTGSSLFYLAAGLTLRSSVSPSCCRMASPTWLSPFSLDLLAVSGSGVTLGVSPPLDASGRTGARAVDTRTGPPVAGTGTPRSRGGGAIQSTLEATIWNEGVTHEPQEHCEPAQLYLPNVLLQRGQQSLP